ncbi:MAG: nucleoside hydrolase [Ilumatobacter sp.]|nr:nucleoside hydrolase [Ilumatobacter sp.]
MPDAPSSSPPPSRPTVLLDCDPGHDDAIAIVTAARHTDLVGITTVAGNAPLERTTHNALVMRDLLGIDVPVHSGAARPLVRDPVFAVDVHGSSGLDGADLPAPTTPLDGTDAARFIAATVRSTEDVWLVPTGPLTNIALAMRIAPDIIDRVRGVSLMGGGSFGNRTATGEFNIWADPEAAHVVFDSGVDLTMAGLDVTHQFLATAERVERVRAAAGALATVLADLMVFFSAIYRERHDDGALLGGAVHDPLAVLAITHPDVFGSVRRRVDVETHGVLTRGMTVIDERLLRSRPAPNCTVLTSVDADTAFELILDAITHFTT